jgi:hypothetical protein
MLIPNDAGGRSPVEGSGHILTSGSFLIMIPTSEAAVAPSRAAPIEARRPEPIEARRPDLTQAIRSKRIACSRATPLSPPTSHRLSRRPSGRLHLPAGRFHLPAAPLPVSVAALVSHRPHSCHSSRLSPDASPRQQERCTRSTTGIIRPIPRDAPADLGLSPARLLPELPVRCD